LAGSLTKGCEFASSATCCRGDYSYKAGVFCRVRENKVKLQCRWGDVAVKAKMIHLIFYNIVGDQ